jgi:hypothetical protein
MLTRASVRKLGLRNCWSFPTVIVRTQKVIVTIRPLWYKQPTTLDNS